MASSSQFIRRGDVLIEYAPSFPPYTTPSLTANLVIRVLFASLAILVCLVPLRLLSRNGEFAASVFIIVVLIKNLETIVNALVWRNNDLHSWWPGYGLCDVDGFVHNAGIGLFSSCMLAIMRNLAQQVGIMRANAPTGKEKRRRVYIQALVIFPFPLLQLALTWPLASQRYQIGAVAGCIWSPLPSWPYLIIFILGPVVLALITAAYAVLTYIRFRQVAKATREALANNRAAIRRSQRTKRRLYLMIMSIFIPFLPIVIAFGVYNILGMEGGPQPFSYAAVHSQTAPLPWNRISLLPAEDIDWVYMNNCYIPIITAVPIFLFFGMTKDAVNQYRSFLLLLRLGRLFPQLHIEYDPDKATSIGASMGSSQTGTLNRPRTAAAKFISSRLLSSLRSASVSNFRQTTPTRAPNLNSSVDIEDGRGAGARSPSNWSLKPKQLAHIDALDSRRKLSDARSDASSQFAPLGFLSLDEVPNFRLSDSQDNWPPTMAPNHLTRESSRPHGSSWSDEETVLVDMPPGLVPSRSRPRSDSPSIEPARARPSTAVLQP